MEAEVRAMLEEAVRPAERPKIGSEIHRIASETGNMDDLDISRARSQIRGADFE
jgi:plasmid stability protein